MAIVFDMEAPKKTKKSKEPETLPAKKKGPLTLEQAKKLLREKFESQIKQMEVKAEAVTIIGEDSEKLAIEMVGQVRKLIKSLDINRKDTIKEQDKFVRDVNKFCKVFKDMLTPIDTGLTQKVNTYQRQKEIARLEKEREARAEADRLAKQVEDEARARGIPEEDIPPIEIVVPVEKKQKVVRTESGTSASMRKDWKMTGIVDFSKVPDEYKTLDERQVNAAIRAGVREITGLKIEEVQTTVFRT